MLLFTLKSGDYFCRKGLLDEPFPIFYAAFFCERIRKEDEKPVYYNLSITLQTKRDEVNFVERRRIVWVSVILIIMLLGYVIPYTLLRTVDAWYGSLLFWSVITVATISVNVMISSAWRD